MSVTYELTGQVAIVTGAGSGIGRAIAAGFAVADARVVVADLAAERAEASAAAITAAGGDALAVPVDVGDEPAVAELVARTLARYGRIDILCNNAGIVDNMALPAEVPTELWDRVLRVNLTGPFLLSRAVLPHLLDQGSGAIINIASEAGLRGGAAGISYTASKHGLIGLTRSLAHAYGGRGIRTNAICPGGVATGIAGPDTFDPQGLAHNRAVLALAGGRVAQPEEVAAVALFLASPAASFVNGAILPADGGWSAA